VGSTRIKIREYSTNVVAQLQPRLRPYGDARLSASIYLPDCWLTCCAQPARPLRGRKGCHELGTP
jgi:hypothetical protein